DLLGRRVGQIAHDLPAQRRIAVQQPVDDIHGAVLRWNREQWSDCQKGNSPWVERAVIQQVSVKASMLAAAPPKRVPVPLAPTPPKGATASSFTVWSLMCTMPLGMRSANCSPAYTSRVRIPSESPYSVPDASATTSSRDENAVTGATGPKISSW